MKTIFLFFGVVILFSFAPAYAAANDNLQVTLISDKSTYLINEPISLKYKVSWQGQEDAEIYFNRLAFPQLDVLFNQQAVMLQGVRSTPIKSKVTGQEVNLRATPGRHEIRVFAPTMSGDSESFVINSPNRPLVYLNGLSGYYVFDKEGTYLIRAKFDMSNPWKLSNKQTQTMWSNTISIEVKSKK